MNAFPDRNQNFITTILLAIYLFIRIILIQLLDYLFNPLPPFVVISIQLAMYLLIIALLVLSKNDLTMNNIDNLSIYLILVGGILLALNYSSSFFAILSSLVFITITFWVFFTFWKLKILSLRIHRSDIIFMIVGFLSGLFLSFLFTTPSITQLRMSTGQLTPRWSTIIIAFSINFLFHFSNAAILEEPIYRGFLWGYFRKKGWKNHYILLMTTLIFWLSHINFMDNPFSFLLFTPLAGLTFGILTWWSGSITSAIVAHSTLNSMRGLAVDVIRKFMNL